MVSPRMTGEILRSGSRQTSVAAMFRKSGDFRYKDGKLRPRLGSLVISPVAEVARLPNYAAADRKSGDFRYEDESGDFRYREGSKES